MRADRVMQKAKLLDALLATYELELAFRYSPEFYADVNAIVRTLPDLVQLAYERAQRSEAEQRLALDAKLSEALRRPPEAPPELEQF